MSQQTTIRKLAELVNTPVDKLLVQLAEAGMKFSGPDQVVTSTEKMKLLGFLRRTHGKAETPAEAASEAAKKITLNRRKLQEVTVSAGRTKTTVNVEVRQKRTYVKSENEGRAAPMTPDEERADILAKLAASRQRNLDEQQRLAESDRMRDEAIQRKRDEEQAAKDRAEAERKAAEEAAAAAR
ncbi:translation initiation factor IF-2 associated domain-containing protein, partial [Xanthomonas vasicola]|uniref:translation initiation factor IF-2 associated domain-containing protein n=1 Tax=Xanthomonas vasicola TaxID=56459 RepID=UPI0001CC0012